MRRCWLILIAAALQAKVELVRLYLRENEGAGEEQRAIGDLRGEPALIAEATELCAPYLRRGLLEDEDIAVGQLHQLDEELRHAEATQHTIEAIEGQEL